MPLTKQTVTVASRLMLPVDAVLSLWIGAAWFFQDNVRTHVPALYAVRAVWPIEATGALIFTVGALIVVAMFTRKRVVGATMVLAGCFCYLLLSVAIAVSVWTQPASYSAPAWPLYVALAHLATALSLAADEFTDAVGVNRRLER